ncbi:LysR family transcriptional regulator [Planococcus ruber]|uniref:LysR family transcriptional regulator n=1 Tax=Planococcus ruber TaxID=2027871 RepID=UPI001FEF3A72|nr:LysR family transcriptional regulator [Planococcus ruber]MCJ1909977.1 LysR family transcriptional regulator [Planococcus ruber]
MNYSQIESFLAIIRLGSLSKAAEHLYVSQSTISQRLHSIEKEYNVTLLNREKGVKSVTLTNEGERFYQIAERFETLYSETKNLKSGSAEATISIGAVDSVHNYVLRDIYSAIVHRLPDTRLAIHTHQSNEIYYLIDQRNIDIGFSLQDRVLKNVKVQKLFEEQMVLIQKKNPGLTQYEMDNSSLNPKQQLFINWGMNYQIWHEKHWGPTSNTFIQIDTAKMLGDFLEEEGMWAIVPVSIARDFHAKGLVDVFLLTDPPPSRSCFQVEKEGGNSQVKEVSKLILGLKAEIEEVVRPWRR